MSRTVFSGVWCQPHCWTGSTKKAICRKPRTDGSLIVIDNSFLASSFSTFLRFSWHLAILQFFPAVKLLVALLVRGFRRPTILNLKSTFAIPRLTISFTGRCTIIASFYLPSTLRLLRKYKTYYFVCGTTPVPVQLGIIKMPLALWLWVPKI